MPKPDQPLVTFEVPCSNCGKGAPVEWPHDHSKFWPLEEQTATLTCANCGMVFTVRRDEQGSSEYVKG